MPLQQAVVKTLDLKRADKKLSLSSYFPKGTRYYYGYPFGQDSGFLNGDTSVRSAELIAARPFSCSGTDVSVVAFPSSLVLCIPEYVLRALHVSLPQDEQVVLLPEILKEDVQPTRRNRLIKHALIKQLPKNSLVMAQPYIDQELEPYYQIPTKLSCYLNDKKNLPDFIDAAFLPKKYGLYHIGAELLEACKELPFPYVIKITASDGGDGVFICRTAEDLGKAADYLEDFIGTLYVEEYIVAKYNCGVQFGIPYDEKMPIELIGISEQITTKGGEFIGGIIPRDPASLGEGIVEAANYILGQVLPSVRKMGWYGIGCFDVLADQYDNSYIIDGNLRMTGMSPALFMARNDSVQSEVLSCTISFEGSDAELVGALHPFVEDRIVRVLSLSRAGDSWKANACVLYKNDSDLRRSIKLLQASGCESGVFEKYKG